MGPLLGLLNEQDKTIEHSPVGADALAGLLQLIGEGAISGKTAKTVFDEMAATGRGAARIVREKGLAQVSDTAALEAAVDKVLAGAPKEVDKYRQGQTKLMGFFVGQVMKATGGKANPGLVNEILKKKLDT